MVVSGCCGTGGGSYLKSPVSVHQARQAKHQQRRPYSVLYQHDTKMRSPDLVIGALLNGSSVIAIVPFLDHLHYCIKAT